MQISGLERRKSLLVYNSFEAHVTDTVKVSFKRKNTDLAVIPGGLTFLLQLLNLSLNKLFKDGVRKQWMADGIRKFTDSGWRRLWRNWSVCGFCKCGKPFHQKWSLPLCWSVGSQIIWMDHKMNWFTIQPRTHRKPVWIGLQVGIWGFCCLKTLNILLKSKAIAMQWWYSSYQLCCEKLWI